ncbi:MAG: STAS/SEC14 domain-containing protein [Candidatus Brocadiales bacterium]|nr:STAS/SEC14 domain-containing protein [Candidatus Brocadiales bacterium]
MIEIMTETEGSILAIKATEKLTTRDYEEVFIPKLDQLIRVFGKRKVVMFLADTFTGWEIGAAWDDAKFGLQHRNDFEKIALVGGPKWVEWTTKIGSHFVGGQVKTYDTSDIQAAISWVKE